MSNIKLLTVAEACEMLRISRTMLFNLRRSGQLSTIVVGKRSIRVSLRAIEDYIERAEGDTR